MTFDEAIKKYADEIGITITQAKEEVEQIIEQHMKADKVPREFAEASFIEDEEDASAEELDALETKAKKEGTTKHKAKAVDAFGKKRTRTVKIDETKVNLIQLIYNALITEGCDAIITNPQKSIDYGDITITITKHRAKKEKG